MLRFPATSSMRQHTAATAEEGEFEGCFTQSDKKRARTQVLFLLEEFFPDGGTSYPLNILAGAKEEDEEEKKRKEEEERKRKEEEQRKAKELEIQPITLQSHDPSLKQRQVRES